MITRGGRVVMVPTPDEDARIAAGIAADPDTYELGAAEIAQLRRPGRPRVAVKRPMLSMRADPDVLAHLRASGKGWQTRVNALLREAVEQGKL
jgi:uncharacterized protein (DUF4415 family)